MAKVIAVTNMTLDGYCDHTATDGADEILQHYTELLKSSGVMVYGRITYQLMEDYWPVLVTSPSGNAPMDEFAVAIDNIPKLVFSHTLKNIDWETARLATQSIEEEISDLKEKSDKDILIGSPGMIMSCLKRNLLDEYQILVHPIVVGHGLPLFKDIEERVELTFLNSKPLECGAVLSYYAPRKNDN